MLDAAVALTPATYLRSRRRSQRAGTVVTFVMPKWWSSALTHRRAKCQSVPIAATTETGTAAVRKP